MRACVALTLLTILASQTACEKDGVAIRTRRGVPTGGGTVNTGSGQGGPKDSGSGSPLLPVGGSVTRPRRPPNPPDKPQPGSSRGGCDPSKISDLVDDGRQAVEAVLAGTGTPASLVPFLAKIPSACLLHIAKKFSRGDCESTDVTTALCQAPRVNQPDVLGAFRRCLPRDAQCDTLKKVIKNGCLYFEHTGAVMGAVLEDGNCVVDDLDVSKIMMAPTIILAQYFRDMPKNKLLETARKIIDGNVVQNLPCNKIQTLVISMTQYHDIDLLELLSLSSLIPYLPRGMCRSAPQSLVKASLLSLGGLGFECTSGIEEDSCREECGRGLAEVLTTGDEPLELTTDNLANLNNLRSCLPGSAIASAVTPGNCGNIDAHSVPRNRRDARRMASACKPNKPVAQWTKSDLTSLGCTLPEMELLDAEALPEAAICDPEILTIIKTCLDDADRPVGPVADRVAKICGGRSGQALTATLLGSLGVVGARVKLQDLNTALKDMTDADFKTIAKGLGNGVQQMAESGARGWHSRARAVISKLSDSNNLNEKENDAVVRVLSNKEFRQIVDTDVKSQLALADGLLSDFGGGKAYLIAMLYLRDKTAADATPDILEELGKLAKGFTAGHIRSMNADWRMEMFRHLAALEDWNGQQGNAIHEMWVEALKDRSESDPWGQLSLDIVAPMSPRAVLGVDGEDLDKMEDDVCETVCQKVGRARKGACFVPIPRFQRIAKACLKCMGKSSGDLDEEDVTTLGQLMSYGGVDLLGRIPDDVLKTVLGALFRRHRCLSKDVIDNLKSRLASLSIAAGDIENLGMWALLLPEQTRTTLKETISDALADIDMTLGPGSKEDMAQEMCCRWGQSEGDRNAVDELQEQVEANVAALVEATAVTTTRRRRRQAGVLSCADVLAMGHSVNQMEVSQISAMVDKEFYNCVPTLGKEPDWSQAQLSALMEKFKNAVGNLCALDSATMYGMGTIAYGMTPQELECINIDEELLASLGSLPGWTQEQMAAVVSAYADNPNLLHTMKIASLGHFICGFTPAQIALIEPSVYGHSSAMLGMLKQCPADQLKALAALATHNEGYGPVSTWDAAISVDIGYVLAGLEGEDLADAGIDDIEGWNARAISLFTAEQVKALSTAQLGAFSREQALALSADQRSELSPAQRNALMTAESGEDASLISDGSGCKMTLSSIGAVISTLIISLLL